MTEQPDKPTNEEGRSDVIPEHTMDECGDAGPVARTAPEPDFPALQKRRLAKELRRERERHPSNRRRSLRRALSVARQFPINTCPASRHAAIIADNLSTYGLDWMLFEEPLHCAGSLYSTVASLWEARTEIARLKAELAAASAISQGGEE